MYQLPIKQYLMKLICLFLLLPILAIGCEKGTITPCNDSAKIVSEFSGRDGTIWFQQASGTYYINYSLPNTIDSVTKGIVCNLPDEFKKDGLKVQYSGKYKDRAKDNTPVPAGTDVYSLELVSITLK
jgi:hypothetical protein